MDQKQNIKEKFKSKDDLVEFLIQKDLNNELLGTNVLELKNILFEFKETILIPFSINRDNDTARRISNFLNSCEYIFEDCQFLSSTTIRDSKRQLEFRSCHFEHYLRVFNRETNLTFKYCLINDLDVSETSFGSSNNKLGKLRIRSSEVYMTNFKNTTFHAFVDFYNTTFHENVIFNKTDFLNILILSAAQFKKNLLFTYTLLNDKVILRSTYFHRGFDFSLAIIKGDLSVFDMKHSYDSYRSVNEPDNEEKYEQSVSINGNIPIQNKLETYRLLKVEFENQKNTPEHLNFRLYEKKTYKSILDQREFSWKNAFDQITLWLNKVSNNHGTSYFRALLFVIIVGLIFFYLSLVSTDSFSISLKPNEWEFSKGLKYFIQYLIPTHKFDYMGSGVSLTPFFYFFDFLGRTFVGYGIYQFIQAFRKFK